MFKEKDTALLYRIKTKKKCEDILNVLKNPIATHYERLWCAGFLNFCGYSKSDVMDIVRVLNCWADYNPRITYYQICSVFKDSVVYRSFPKDLGSEHGSEPCSAPSSPQYRGIYEGWLVGYERVKKEKGDVL